MKLLVRVIEARDIPPMDPNGFSDPYVKLQLGKQRFKTKVVKKCLNPSWCEEFAFRVDDLKEELLISVLDEDKYFNDDFVGQIKVPISRVFDAPDNSLGTAWYTLQPKNKKAKNKDCGEILLTICLSQSNSFVDLQSGGDNGPLSRKYADMTMGSPSRPANGPPRSPSPVRLEEAAPAPSKEERSHAQTFAGRIAQMFNKNGDTASAATNKVPDVLEPFESANSADDEDKSDDQPSSSSFEELMRSLEVKEQGGDIPSNLPGGVVLDQMYAIAPHELNSLLFSQDSNFFKSATDMQGSTELQVGPWKFENGGENLTRTVSYIKAATKLIKALRATEDQTYLKADGNTFAVFSSVSTPDAPYGSCFRAEVLYCITSGPELPSGEQSSRLVVSWRMNFLQSTMMKGMIESGARQGIKDSFVVYGNLLSQTVKPVDMKDVSTEKEQVLASLKVEQQSDWKLAVEYFANFTVISTIFVGLYVFVHISLAMPGTIQGLEFVGLDLPDSIGELVVCGILVLQGKRVLELMSRFMQARVRKGSDHGIKAQGDGWLLTVALIEGNNLAAVDSSGYSDPYVVFTCNGKTRTSSIKFQKSDPLWNEIFEFDAMDEPPSVLEVEIFDFDGPFDEATSLGHAEINFLKSNISDLSDVWVPLQGKLAQACQSKLHLRIFLNNTRGTNVVKDYLSKMEKEVGKKIRLRSPQTNSAFQKLFGLPPEEFLINDFTCHLKRKMPLQGRLFLSARIIGFHADLFGHKTKFFFLWEDIEDIQVVAPTLSSMGSPIVIMTLKPGRGFDARHGAKTQDEAGRLKFHFHSFVSFNIANRTIMALWKARALSPEQKVQIVEEESETKNLQVSQETDEDSESKSLHAEESGSFLGVEDVSMSLLYSSVLSIPMSFFMELFGGNDLDRKVMERVGCLNYSYSPWESEKPDVYQRQLYYKFDKRISRYRGEVTSTQQKSRLSERNGWVIEEVMTLHGVPLGDYFNLHMRYQVEDAPSRSMGCSVQVYFGLAWLKYTRHQKRITKNILVNLQERLLVMFSVLEKEFVTGR
ncbi:C2 and GRAM domain-containing protein At1g03370 [Coffea eugenioides]|uniref:C2 and GRAM domain-containing protein At1g03370-like n=1 Tax=Coffea arabica TaxID=13443 RepID=A0ABM4VRM0_COFAR|nr:C2 and GRAM domain-containing protein At1g03370 [Coffea eugenioides]